MHLSGWMTPRKFASHAVLLVLAALGPAIATAQKGTGIVGAYDGVIGTQQATLHLRVRPDGTLTATLDHLEPKAPWMFTCADVQTDGKNLSFTVPSVQASWKGTFSNDGTLSGTWTQKGNSLLIVFARVPFVPAAKPSALDGIWLGISQNSASTSTRVQVLFRSDAQGREFCTTDALDIYYMDMECANVAFQGGAVSFDVPVAGMHWSGRLSADGQSLTGNTMVKLIEGGLTRDLAQPLNFERQEKLALEKARPQASYDAAMEPLEAADLEAVLDRDLAAALQKGELAPSTGGGVAIGVYAHGVRRVFCYGTAKPDSIFEIGSMTKPFTGLLLAQMAAQSKVKLDEPVRELLPTGTVAKPAGAEITLLDLAAQRSGLPTMPDNISVENLDQPYADYHTADLLTYLAKRGVANTSHATSSFGSLGYALLGAALAERAGMTYGDLIRTEIAEPLGMADTGTTLSPQQEARFLPGHDEYHGPAKPWDSDALAPAIGLRSTAADMLTFLVACLHPEQLKRGDSTAGSTLPAAIRASLANQGEISPGMRIALGWLYESETGNYWHNGATAAYSGYAFFNPKGDYAAVVLLNGSPGVNGSFVENLGRHVSQRLAGKPAITLQP